MSVFIAERLRQFVEKRAKNRCEYCRVSVLNAYFSFHIDHIVSLKHGGLTIVDNLAYACALCNLNKGSDIATFLGATQVPTRFFNPRTDVWDDHFETLQTGELIAKTDIGEATIKILKLNQVDAIIERQEMIRFGDF
jgi:HNH endonuclease